MGCLETVEKPDPPHIVNILFSLFIFVKSISFKFYMNILIYLDLGFRFSNGFVCIKFKDTFLHHVYI